MQVRASLATRVLRRALLPAAPVLTLLMLLAGPSSQAPASPNPQSFNPTLSLAISIHAPGANATVTLASTLPTANHLPGQLFYLVPKFWAVAADSAIANGDVVGSVSLAADFNCDGNIDPPLTSNLTDVADPDNHAHWTATLGPPLNLTLEYLVDPNLDDPDVDYDIAVAIFPNNGSSACTPLTFITTINGVSGQGTPVLTNPQPSRTYIWRAIYISAPVSQLEHIVSRSAPVCIGDPDGDSDGICNVDDNCPTVANPDQWDANINGLGDARDPADTDGDGFSDRVEYRTRTSRQAACGFNAWPADITDNTFSDVGDITYLTGNFAASVPPAPARYNIAPDPLDNFIDTADIAKMTSFFGQGCAPCAVDLDCDGVSNVVDNCPNWPNPAQDLPSWPIPVNDPDCDGFSTAVENAAGTNALVHCGAGAWPADVNDDTFSDVTDISFLTGNFGMSVPPAPARHNIAPDPVDTFIDTADIAKMTAFFSLTCS